MSRIALEARRTARRPLTTVPPRLVFLVFAVGFVAFGSTFAAATARAQEPAPAATPATTPATPAATPTPTPPATGTSGVSVSPERDLPVVSGEVEVTTTRVPESVEPEPAEITVVTREELAARGVHDMAGALALLGGVSIAPGGESGPAGFVPELWGLREVDAFLLVVDGVPWGGAFNPDTQALDLTNVERIEVLRGAAPVMYGATAFSGVIHIIHRDAGSGPDSAALWGGNYSSGGAEAQVNLPGRGNFRHSLIVDGEKVGYADEKAGLQRGHVLYRASTPGAGGTWRFDADALFQKQDPTSPRSRGNAVTVLDPRTPEDANYNPSDAKLDENRIHLVGGYDRALLGGSWTTTLALTHSSRTNVRGFIRRDEISGEPDVTADGFSQDVKLTDLYFDTHVAWNPLEPLRLVLGFDELYGDGKQDSDNFEYEVGLDGEGAPSSGSLHVDEYTRMKDTRSFAGLYGQAEWQPTARWNVEAGLRLNHTRETRSGGVVPNDGSGDPGEEVSDAQTITRASGVLGVNGLVWDNGRDGLWFFADYRNSFKPAALDFGPEVEGSRILDPETSYSYEAGLKGNLERVRVRWQLTAFDMHLENLVVNVDRNGLPGLANGGKQEFKGVEVEGTWRLLSDLEWQGAASWHRARFEDYSQSFDGVPTQLAGNRPELVPDEIYSTGLSWAPALGFNAHARVEWVGDRYLDRRNRVLAPSYDTWSAGIGYRFQRWELRLDGDNLNDVRPPVSESELGDAQFYLLPARAIRLTGSYRF